MQIRLDTIKFKVFMHIMEHGDFGIYSKSKKKQAKLESVWIDLQAEYEKLKGDSKSSTILSLKSEIRSVLAKFKTINLCCEILRFKESEDAIKILQEHYFFIDSSNYHSELDRIENESQSYLIQIEKLKKQLPEEDEKEDQNPINHDEIILGYCAFIGVQLQPNKATVTEVLAVEKLFLNKLKELKKTQRNGG